MRKLVKSVLTKQRINTKYIAINTQKVSHIKIYTVSNVQVELGVKLRGPSPSSLALTCMCQDPCRGCRGTGTCTGPVDCPALLGTEQVLFLLSPFLHECLLALHGSCRYRSGQIIFSPTKLTLWRRIDLKLH